MSEFSAATKRSRRAIAASLTASAALALSAYGWVPVVRAESRPVSADSAAAMPALPGDRIDLAFTAHFDGVGTEGIDNIWWSGKILGSDPGEVVIHVEQLGPASDRATAVWPVRATVTVAADNPIWSFAANMEGTLDWPSGSLQLHGKVSEGWMKGAPVQQIVTLDRIEFDGAGTLSLGLVTALRGERTTGTDTDTNTGTPTGGRSSCRSAGIRDIRP
jgi:hypothetical protein